MTDATEPVIDDQRRRLTRAEAIEILDRPIVGVLSTLSEGGWIHSAPVHYRYADEEVRILAGSGAVKTRNVRRSGTATFCVEVTDGPVRSFVTLVCEAGERPPVEADLLALDERYGRTDFAEGWTEAELAGEVMLVLSPTRWIAWTDWD